MDDPGWHARRRAAHANEDDYPAFRGPDGRFRPVEQVLPLEEGFIGGMERFRTTITRTITFPIGKRRKRWRPHLVQSGYPFVHAPSPIPPPTAQGLHPSFNDSQRPQLSAIERSQTLKMRRMNPYLQFMCGPLLRYDTVDERGVWHGAALIVTADAGSIYEPSPAFTTTPGMDTRIELGPHPADPLAQPFQGLEGGEHFQGPNLQKQKVLGQEIYVYSGRGGTYTFWRFLIRIPLTQSEMKIQYTVNDGLEMDFFVPARNQTMRLAAYSCNGFSAGLNPDDFRGPGFQSGYDPVWVDLLAKHAERPFHVLVGGGDQLYCDGITREPELQEWVNHPKPEEKKKCPLTQEILSALDRFYFNHYCQTFRSGAFARANSSIPMLNMADPDDLQKAPIFNTIGSRGFFFYLLFQCFINVSVDGIDDRPGAHPMKSLILGGPGAYVPFPSHSFLTPIGPTAWLLMLDCRAERKLSQVCSQEEYKKVFQRLHTLPPGVEHLIVQIGIPIAYPRMVFLETALSSKFNPLITLGRSGSLGLKGFVNKFNADAELLDDLNDHWTSKYHKAERNWLIEQLQLFARHRRIRVSLLSGDVHCAAVGVLKTLRKGKKAAALNPELDHRYMLNIVTSMEAILYSRPPNGVLTMVSTLSTKRHRTLHYADTDEEMCPLFVKDTDGSKPKSQYIMGRRNWCSITLEQPTGELLFDIRVEKTKGHGETIGYPIRAPPPRWTPK
ncbi:hypothetical protein BJY52DRAFT_1204831 [Lactarius psammicola]|nr:hypothetical protein BJY52DRAFT_1204831 [Lactarius psammicola]